jgi:hypothetical protein
MTEGQAQGETLACHFLGRLSGPQFRDRFAWREKNLPASGQRLRGERERLELRAPESVQS